MKIDFKSFLYRIRFKKAILAAEMINMPRDSITLSKTFLGCFLIAGVFAFHFCYNFDPLKGTESIHKTVPPGTWLVSAVATFIMIFYAYNVDGFINYVKREVDAFVINNRLLKLTTFKKFNNQVIPINNNP